MNLLCAPITAKYDDVNHRGIFNKTFNSCSRLRDDLDWPINQVNDIPENVVIASILHILDVLTKSFFF